MLFCVNLKSGEKNLRFFASLVFTGFSPPLSAKKPPLSLRYPSAFLGVIHMVNFPDHILPV